MAVRNLLQRHTACNALLGPWMLHGSTVFRLSNGPALSGLRAQTTGHCAALERFGAGTALRNQLVFATHDNVWSGPARRRFALQRRGRVLHSLIVLRLEDSRHRLLLRVLQLTAC